ncbi:acetylglucosaminyldiphosphoundecaprenol acetyl-beta-D-mannosaminyltransferase [Alicyclobacillus contaminans]|uniref:WecB/TagA/CpsF family glycosyltransferase n=1 Tax=Alicyclobacillus contaminans TaxID=392016 RepID=UPI001FE15034|nr:WecB/TagA/CpsF family glycosyltransferase [Alicyclobacillus contaminans]GMA51285.1 acetylglucosaminyldiphosphoundecaprenol acetyl-beta-D-mannosaminyltransferase [Alicyclobacillus contaminans]
MALGAEMQQEAVVHVLGVRFHTLTKQQAVERILYWIDQKSRRMVITAGPEFVMQTQKDEALRRIARAADLVTPDGIGVVWAANRRRRMVSERVTGVELVQELLETAEQRHQSLRVYVLGASETSLQACLANFRASYPGCEFAGENGYFRPEDLPQVLARVEAFAPHVWLVGLGQPRQEKLIYEALGGLPPCVAIGVGGSIDVWGGTVKRAPLLFRRLNLEWLYRLLKQPSRWRRQLALPRFAWKVLRNLDGDD